MTHICDGSLQQVPKEEGQKTVFGLAIWIKGCPDAATFTSLIFDLFENKFWIKYCSDSGMYDNIVDMLKSFKQKYDCLS